MKVTEWKDTLRYNDQSVVVMLYQLLIMTPYLFIRDTKLKPTKLTLR